MSGPQEYAERRIAKRQERERRIQEAKRRKDPWGELVAYLEYHGREDLTRWLVSQKWPGGAVQPVEPPALAGLTAGELYELISEHVSSKTEVGVVFDLGAPQAGLSWIRQGLRAALVRRFSTPPGDDPGVDEMLLLGPLGDDVNSHRWTVESGTIGMVKGPW